MKEWSKARRRAMPSFALALLVGPVLFALAACSDGDRRASNGNEPIILRVAAASGLTYAMPEIIREFEAAHPRVEVEPTFGASGLLMAQIQRGAPFDIFLSADRNEADALAEMGLALDGAVFTYAIGCLAIWTPHASSLDVLGEKIDVLTNPEVRYISIANPVHAPYGRAAVEALRSWGIYDSVASKLVPGENVAQAAQFVESGAAQVGIIALSLAMAEPMAERGSYWEVPVETFSEMRQGGIVVAATSIPDRALAFRDFLLGESGQALLNRHGFRSASVVSAEGER